MRLKLLVSLGQKARILGSYNPAESGEVGHSALQKLDLLFGLLRKVHVVVSAGMRAV